MVELYDPGSGRLIMRQQLPGYGVLLEKDLRLISLERTADNRLSIKLSQLEFSRR